MKKLSFLLLLMMSTALSAKPITATSWLVADGEGNIIKSQNPETVQPIASISKLVTAMIVIDAHQDMSEKIGNFTREQLIQMALVKSDNRSANLLCEHYPGGRGNCVDAMNAKARELYMNNTHFFEPTGLSVFNTSTAHDLVNLVIGASGYKQITDAAHTPTVKVRVKRKLFIFKNTNPLIGYDQHIVVSKTGYIHAAGGCLVMMMDTEIGRRILVLLGSKNTHTRIPEAVVIIKDDTKSETGLMNFLHKSKLTQ